MTNPLSTARAAYRNWASACEPAFQEQLKTDCPPARGAFILFLQEALKEHGISASHTHIVDPAAPRYGRHHDEMPRVPAIIISGKNIDKGIAKKYGFKRSYVMHAPRGYAKWTHMDPEKVDMLSLLRDIARHA